MSARSRTGAVVLALHLLGSVATAGQPATEEQEELLRQGEVLFSVDAGDRSGLPLFRAAAVIDCPRPEVWRVINDYNRLKEIIPGIVESRIERVEDNAVYFYEEDDVPILKNTRLLLRCVHDDPNFRKTMSLVEGSVRSLEASWALEPFDRDRTLAVYTLRTDPGFYVPLWLQKTAAKKTVRGFFRGVRKAACAHEEAR